MLASLVPRCMQILSSGDGLEAHFQVVFQNLFDKFLRIILHEFKVPHVDLGPQTISEALPSAKRANYFQR